MTTESNKSLLNLTGKNLPFKQRSAIDLLLQGLSDREVAEKVGVRRETVNVWRNHNPVFQAELEKARRELFGNKVEEVNKRIEAVKATDPLSPQGIRERLHLKDSLILDDLGMFNEKRVRIIQRLESHIQQGTDHIRSLQELEGTEEQTMLAMNFYKDRLLHTLVNILNDVVKPEVKEMIVARLGKEMET